MYLSPIITYHSRNYKSSRPASGRFPKSGSTMRAAPDQHVKLMGKLGEIHHIHKPSTSLNNNLSWKEQMVGEHSVSRSTKMSWIQVTFYGLFCLNLQVYERRKDLLMANLAAPTWDKLPIKAINCCRVSAPIAYLSQKNNKTKTLAKKTW